MSSIEAKRHNSLTKFPKMASAVASGVSQGVTRVKDEVTEYWHRRRIELRGLTLKRHSYALIFTAAANVLFYIIGLSTPNMIQGELICYRGVPCPIAGNTPEQNTIQVGLWKAYLNDVPYDLCDGWPTASSNASLCDSVKATRAFVFLAIISCIAAIIGAVVRLLDNDDKMPFKVIIAMGVSGLCGMIAYSIWQGSVADPLNDLIGDALVVGRGYSGQVRYWRTVGYSYALILWSWVFTFMFLGAKLYLPGLNTIDQKIERETAGAIGTTRM